jgi:C4-dicarboxylate transporter, DctM subunit
VIPAHEEEHPPQTALFRWVHRAENVGINVVFLVMTTLPVLEMLLRKLFGAGLPGAQAIVQHLTLWAGFLGALLATREGRHLSMSTAELLPVGKPRAIARVFSYSIACAVTALLAYASLKLIEAEAEGHNKLVGDIPEWWTYVIMPIALSLMALRLAWRSSDRWIGRAIAIAAGGAVFLLSLFSENPGVVVWPLSILLLAALLLGAPIYVAMSGFAMLFFFGDEVPIASVPTETLRLVISPTLPAIPLLTAAGFILSEGGAARRLVRVCRAWIGWVPGGMAIMVCLVCALFTAFTGGSGVTILALGGLVLPILLTERYPEGFSLGLVTASGSLGLLFPPSLPVILYSVVAQIPDLDALFIAGFVPGLLMIVLVCIYGVWIGIKSKTPRTPFRVDEALSSLWEAKWELGLPIFVGAMFLGGWATIVEAAAVACLAAIIVEVFVFKDIPLDKMPATLVHAGTLVGSVLIVLGFALGLTSYLVDANIPEAVISWVKSHIESQLGFLFVLNAMLLVLGSVLEIFAAIVILAPLVAPLGEAYGVDKIHLAIVFLANLELGFLFPPVGLNLFLSSSRFNKPLPQLYKNAFPFLCIMTLGVLIVTYVPAMTVGVLRLFGSSP